ncbi:cysteine dioxygenase family protein [Saccharothrix longispora]|uniref:Metal-dependent enzyme (Double-stranded beta helix superfamily) n=1 Tax=Saccharothrix longispora TaxID=33920 RepID=A0ABU1PSC6_9PSEU|nr:cysteine dioxygenase family protein [Saccharothrix longispora]MDR6593486.1 putative metal-dependent enzyme (double-stranded beta helix superfamily) [Saccharothrix longispora]
MPRGEVPASEVLVSSRTAELVAAVRRVLCCSSGRERPDRTARRVAAVLAPFLAHDDLLITRHLESHPHTLRHVLHVDPEGRFSLVVTVRPPGGETPVHDHTTWCVSGSYRGAETETRYRPVTSHDGRTVLVPFRTTVRPVGTVTHLAPPGDVHSVRNATDDAVVTLHVYGADVRIDGTGVRHRHDEVGATDAPAVERHDEASPHDG